MHVYDYAKEEATLEIISHLTVINYSFKYEPTLISYFKCFSV